MFDRYWNRISDADPRAIAIYERHYSAHNADRFRGLQPDHNKGIAGAGQRIVLMTSGSDALFVWKRFLPRTGRAGNYFWMNGIWCSVFRNEGDYVSSQMVLEAEEWAWWKWPGETLRTFIDPASVVSLNPGYCFKKAGWQRRRDMITKRGLHILEKPCPP
jgi:hypothetical protein